jgi:hypothetical protein
MNYNEIDRLIEHYLEGDTSLADEEILRVFLSRDDLPEKYRALAHMFNGMQSLREEHLPDKHFDQRITRKIGQSAYRRFPFSLSFNWYALAGVAATVVLAVLLFVPVKKYPILNLFSEKVQDTFDDPQKAYTETIRVLLLVSDKLNAGTKQMEGMKEFGKGIEDASKMLTFNKGVKEVGELNKLEKNSRPVSKLNKMDQGINEANKLERFNENKINTNNL